MRILIIEDEPAHRENFKKILTNHELIFPPIPFPDLEKMKDFVRESSADIILLDLLFLNVKYSGYDLYPELASNGKKWICISTGFGSIPNMRSWSGKNTLEVMLKNPEHPRSKAKLQELLDLIESK